MKHLFSILSILSLSACAAFAQLNPNGAQPTALNQTYGSPSRYLLLDGQSVILDGNFISRNHVALQADVQSFKPIALVIDGDSESCPVYNGNLTNQNWPYHLLTNSPLLALATFTNSAVSGDYATNIANVYATRDKPQITNAVAHGQTVYWMPYAGQNDLGNGQFGTNIAFAAVSNLWRLGHADGAKVVAFEIPYNYGLGGSVLKDYTNFNLMVEAATNLYDFRINPLDVLSQADTIDNLHYTPIANGKLSSYIYEKVFGSGISNRFFGNVTARTAGVTTLNVTNVNVANLSVTLINGSSYAPQSNAPIAFAFNPADVFHPGVTNLGGLNTTPTFGVYGAAYFSTNTLGFLLLPAPFGHGFNNIVTTIVFEGEVAATSTTINASQLQFNAKRVTASYPTDNQITPTFTLTAATKTVVTATNTWANDTDPRQILILFNSLPTSYGKNALYIDSITCREQ